MLLTDCAACYQIGAHSIRIEALLGQQRRRRFARVHELSADLRSSPLLFDPRTHRDLADVGNHAHLIHLLVQRIAAPVVHQTEALADAAGVVHLVLLEHRRRHGGKHLRQTERPQILRPHPVRIVAIRRQFVGIRPRAVDQALRSAQQPLLLQLIQRAQIPVGHASHQSMHQIRLIYDGVQRILHTHPHADRIPQRQIHIRAVGTHLQQSVEQFVGYGHPPIGLRLVVTDARLLDLPQIVHGQELVDELVTHDRVGWIGHRRILLDTDPKPGIVDHLVHPDERLDHHVHGEVLPLEQNLSQSDFVAPTLLICAAQGQLVAHLHLVPADLVYRHHGAVRLEPVELAPQLPLLLLHGQRGDLRHLRGQFPNDLPILRIQHDRSLLFSLYRDNLTRLDISLRLTGAIKTFSGLWSSSEYLFPAPLISGLPEPRG